MDEVRHPTRADFRAEGKRRKRQKSFARQVANRRAKDAAEILRMDRRGCAENPAALAFGIGEDRNPNRAKRHAARLADPAALRTRADVGLQYVSIVTPGRDKLGRRNPRMAARETITTRRGRTIIADAPAR